MPLPDILTESLQNPNKRLRTPPFVAEGLDDDETPTAPPAAAAPPAAPLVRPAAAPVQQSTAALREHLANQPVQAKGARAVGGTIASILGSLVNPQIGHILSQKLLYPGQLEWDKRQKVLEDMQMADVREAQRLQAIASAEDTRQNRLDINADRDAARKLDQQKTATAEIDRLTSPQHGGEMIGNTTIREAMPMTPGAPENPLANLPGARVNKMAVAPGYAPGVGTRPKAVGDQDINPRTGLPYSAEGSIRRVPGVDGRTAGTVLVPTAETLAAKALAKRKGEKQADKEIEQEDWHVVTPEEEKKLGDYGLSAGQKLSAADMRAVAKDARDGGWIYKESVDDDGKLREWWVNPRTKQSTDPVVKGSIGKSKSDPMMIGGMSGPQFTQAQNRAREFDNLPIVKDFNVQVNKFDTLQRLLAKKQSGPGDLAMVYEFMKGLDPNSVVRESEYETARKAGNWFYGEMAQLKGFFDPDGGFISPEAKAKFAEIVESKLAASRDQVKTLHKDFSRRIDELTGVPGSGDKTLTDYSKIFSPKSEKGATPTVDTEAEYNALPKGAKYIDKADGKQYTKR